MPICEYTKEEKAVDGKRVRVKVFSTQRDMTGTGFFGEAAMAGDTPEEILNDINSSKNSEVNNTYVLTTEGVLKAEGEIKLTYSEDIPDMPPCETVISFSPEEPKCIGIERSGSVASGFIIEQGRRRYSNYNTPYGTLEMCLYGKKIDNKITENGGTLILDYAVELKGMTAQRTKMRVEVKPE